MGGNGCGAAEVGQGQSGQQDVLMEGLESGQEGMGGLTLSDEECAIFLLKEGIAA